ncbi:MAG: F0F1 ATP synthase subunit alpha, partial [Helicobacter sp.]|nr:F0F1 ATP synthase subunit alpha [Helicobacter sp.]
GYMDDIPVSDIIKFESDLYPFLEAKYPQIFEDICSKKMLDKDIEETLCKALEEFKASFSA